MCLLPIKLEEKEKHLILSLEPKKKKKMPLLIHYHNYQVVKSYQEKFLFIWLDKPIPLLHVFACHSMHGFSTRAQLMPYNKIIQFI